MTKSVVLDTGVYVIRMRRNIAKHCLNFLLAGPTSSKCSADKPACVNASKRTTAAIDLLLPKKNTIEKGIMDMPAACSPRNLISNAWESVSKLKAAVHVMGNLVGDVTGLGLPCRVLGCARSSLTAPGRFAQQVDV